MKKGRWLLILLIVLALGVCSGCSASGGEEPTSAEPPFNDAFVSKINAAGVVLPQDSVLLAPASGGIVAEVYVSEGQEVREGELLLRLRGVEALDSAVATAELERVLAEQALQDIYEQAEMAYAQALQTLAQARDALDDAEYTFTVRQEGNRASQETIAAAQANLVLAQEEVDRAQKEYSKYSGRSADDPQRALARAKLADARKLRDSIQRNLNWYLGYPTNIEQAMLTADVALAEARVNDAERTVERCQDGPDPDLVEAAEARLFNAEAALTAALAAQDNLVLEAPFDGVVVEVHTSAFEWIAPGQPALLLADLSSYYVETTDLNEIDVARFSVGSSATINFDALPGLIVEARVRSIGLKASQGTGVNYTVALDLLEVPDNLRWGMTAFVDIKPEE